MIATRNNRSGSFAARAFPVGLIACVIGVGLYFDHSDSFAVSGPAPQVNASTRTSAEVREAQWAMIAWDRANMETSMNDSKPRKADDKPVKAPHGPRSEVNWEGGSGRQPYANQGSTEAEEPNAPADHVAEGNRGKSSGRNLEQLDEAKRKP